MDHVGGNGIHHHCTRLQPRLTVGSQNQPETAFEFDQTEISRSRNHRRVADQAPQRLLQSRTGQPRVSQSVPGGRVPLLRRREPKAGVRTPQLRELPQTAHGFHRVAGAGVFECTGIQTRLSEHRIGVHAMRLKTLPDQPRPRCNGGKRHSIPLSRPACRSGTSRCSVRSRNRPFRLTSNVNDLTP